MMKDHVKIPLDKIGFDFDGVIIDIGEAFVRLACEKHGYCSFSVDDITSFDVEKSLEMPMPLVMDIFDDILEDSVATGVKPLPHMLEVVSDITKRADVNIITARSLAEPVCKWFDVHLPATVVHKINVITTGDHDDKVRYLQDLGLSYFVDDRLETCKMLEAENITPIVFEQPWNANQHSMQNVSTWLELKDLLDL